MKKITGVLLDVENSVVEKVTIDDTCEAIYELLRIDIFDVAYRKIGGKYFSIYCDDEGLLKSGNKISAIDNLGNGMLVGNLFIVDGEVDDEGCSISISDDDAELVIRKIQKMYTLKHPEGYLMLTQCEY